IVAANCIALIASTILFSSRMAAIGRSSPPWRSADSAWGAYLPSIHCRLPTAFRRTKPVAQSASINSPHRRLFLRKRAKRYSAGALYSARRHCQLKRPWYAARVGGAAARVGELLLLAYRAAPLKPSGAGNRCPRSAKLTIPLADLLPEDGRVSAPASTAK